MQQINQTPYEQFARVFCKHIALRLTDQLKGKIMVTPNTKNDTYVITLTFRDLSVCQEYNNLGTYYHLGYDKEQVCQIFIKDFNRIIHNLYYKDPNFNKNLKKVVDNQTNL